MTRVNVISVEELTDNFILAEYFELPRLFPLIKKAAARNDTNIPINYRLGSGHMRFFYDKLTYLYNRHTELHLEAMKRGFAQHLKVDPNVSRDYIYRQDFLTNIPEFYKKDYEPTPEALQLNRDRLQYRRRYNGGTYA